jgi:hypothetical protein
VSRQRVRGPVAAHSVSESHRQPQRPEVRQSITEVAWEVVPILKPNASEGADYRRAHRGLPGRCACSLRAEASRVVDGELAWEGTEDSLAASAVSGRVLRAGPRWRRGLSQPLAAALGSDEPLCATPPASMTSVNCVRDSSRMFGPSDRIAGEKLNPPNDRKVCSPRFIGKPPLR